MYTPRTLFPFPPSRSPTLSLSSPPIPRSSPTAPSLRWRKGRGRGRDPSHRQYGSFSQLCAPLLLECGACLEVDHEIANLTARCDGALVHLTPLPMVHVNVTSLQQTHCTSRLMITHIANNYVVGRPLLLHHHIITANNTIS